ncbi:MAG: enoyl-CoA hydratase/isomerase family protein [Hydrogenophaga sp.]|uniref:enoyl-CoA hydratase/isomerase family protein n=1 Tax=Hydrogenophaga sp. TaxID=1904254 RepID=UPI0026338201|nr:enoyl-CoA hydratase/isomerase family protein [Hydrogenophaga sp.]MCW5668695.1 enoyl-CoA hydratase/isomerase family protein [Hydrogenophaga sp.]
MDTSTKTLPGWQFNRDNDGIVVAALDLPGKVNIMNDDFIDAMECLLSELEASRDYAGVVLTSAKPVFLAGGDLKRMVRSAPGQESALFDYFQQLKSYLRRLERLNRPVVAAINGSALGGGYETCLACHHRIALREPRLRLGLPEIEFGILAGAGGVVRLTRLLGFERATPYLTQGTLEDVMGALEHGLVDDLADDAQQLLEKSKAWIRANPQARQPWDKPDNATPAHRLSANQRRALMLEPARLSRLMAGHPAAFAAQRNMALAAESLNMDFDAALRYETRVLIELLRTDHARERMQEFLDRKSPRKAQPSEAERSAA